jgi:hypothetical protein
MKFLNQIKYILVVILVVFFIEFLSKYFSCSLFLNTFSNGDVLTLIQISITVIGGTWALRLYYVANIKNKEDFLKMYVSATNDNNVVTIKTEVKNETKSNRKIKTAFLIITLQGKNIIDEVNNNLNQQVKKTNDFIVIKNSANYSSENFAFIKLPYYYSENLRVGNEHLSFSIAGTENMNLNNLNKKIYEVRFFVYRKYNLLNPYHRCVQTCFISESKLDSLFIDLPDEAKDEKLEKQKKKFKN